MADPNDTFGGRLRQARLDAGLTQSQLVAASGIPKPTISRYENGHVMPSLGTLERLARALGVPEGSLLPGATSQEEELYQALRDLGVRIRDADEARRVAELVARFIQPSEQQQA